MTREEVLQMPAGPALDALVAERVMGLRILTREEMEAEAQRVWPEQPKCRRFFLGFDAWRGPDGEIATRQHIPDYSTDPGTAWRVVEKLSAKCWWKLSTPFERGLPCWAGLTPHGVTGWNGRPDVEASGADIPLAICRAALIYAMEADVFPPEQTGAD